MLQLSVVALENFIIGDHRSQNFGKLILGGLRGEPKLLLWVQNEDSGENKVTYRVSKGLQSSLGILNQIF